jgi:ethanolamine utilization protein EutA (predicted chaperonin)
MGSGRKTNSGALQMTVININKKLIQKVRADINARALNSSRNIKIHEQKLYSLLCRAKTKEEIVALMQSMIELIWDSANLMKASQNSNQSLKPKELADLYYTCILNLSKIDVASEYLKKLSTKLHDIEGESLHEHLLMIVTKIRESK